MSPTSSRGRPPSTRAPHAGPAGRAHPRGRLRCLRVRPGRLDDQRGRCRRTGQASPRDNVVFEAGLFGGVLGMRRTFILHANGAKLPTDLLGLTCVRYAAPTTSAEMRTINQKLRNGHRGRGSRRALEGLWWQLSLTARTAEEPSAVSLLQISRDRARRPGGPGRAWQEDGTLSSRYWSEAQGEEATRPSIFYYWKGERPRAPERPAARRHRRDPAGIPRPRRRLLITRSDAHPDAQRAHLRHLPARRPRRPGHPGRRRRRSSARR